MPTLPEKPNPSISLSYFVRKQQKANNKSFSNSYTSPPHHTPNKSELLLNKFIIKCINFKQIYSACEPPKRRNTSVTLTSKLPALPYSISTQYAQFCKTYSETKKPSCITLTMKLHRASQERDAIYKRLAKAKPLK